MLRHINQSGLYWYCTHCRQMMPLFAKDGSVLGESQEEKSNLGDRPCSPNGDRSASAKTYWLYIPIQPEQRKTA